MAIEFEQTQNIPNSFLVKLPSQGKLYPEGHLLRNVSELLVKNLTGDEVDIIVNSSYIRSGKVMDMLLLNCVKLKGFSPSLLVSIDEDAILTQLRLNGMGHSYTPYEPVECKKCKTSHKDYTYQISSIYHDDITDFNLVEKEFNIDGTPVTLPVIQINWDGHEIYYRVLTNAENAKMRESIKKIEERGVGTVSKSAILFSEKVVSFDGETAKYKLQSMYKSMPIQKAMDVLKQLKDPIYTLKTTYTCPKPDCGYSEEVDVDFDITFLYPRDAK